MPIAGDSPARFEFGARHTTRVWVKRIRFNLQPITSKVKLAEIMRLAGEEARWAELKRDGRGTALWRLCRDQVSGSAGIR